jgi:hypothetical protein
VSLVVAFGTAILSVLLIRGFLLLTQKKKHNWHSIFICVEKLEKMAPCLYFRFPAESTQFHKGKANIWAGLLVSSYTNVKHSSGFTEM